jgi:hypothetical protein
MCEYDPAKPYQLELARRTKRDGSTILTYTFPLGKVTSLRNKNHFSGSGFLWPIGKTVRDPNARPGMHGPCLHFTASAASAFAPGFSSYGSHPLVVLPGPQLWDDPFGHAGLSNRCWHSASGVVLLCAGCLNLKPKDLKNPAFWQEILKPRHRRHAASSDADYFDLRIPRTAIWHWEEQVAAPALLGSTQSTSDMRQRRLAYV